MNPVAWNVVLAVAWMGITGSFTPANFSLGLAVGFVALIVSQRIPGVPRYTGRAWRVLALAWFTAVDVVRANIRVSRDVISMKQMHPAFVSIPIRSRTDTEVALLAAFITLSPGTTAIDISPDGRHLLVHITNLPRGGPEQVRRDILDGFERQILAVLR